MIFLYFALVPWPRCLILSLPSTEARFLIKPWNSTNTWKYCECVKHTLQLRTMAFQHQSLTQNGPIKFESIAVNHSSRTVFGREQPQQKMCTVWAPGRMQSLGLNFLNEENVLCKQRHANWMHKPCKLGFLFAFQWALNMYWLTLNGCSYDSFFCKLALVLNSAKETFTYFNCHFGMRSIL